jgi:hypothetical protein
MVDLFRTDPFRSYRRLHVRYSYQSQTHWPKAYYETGHANLIIWD